MIAGKRVLGVVPARGGSKGLPRKNALPAGGKPLLQWTIDAAKPSRFIDRLILSSDDAELMAIAKACGCDAPFVRPASLASDSAGMVDVVLHALDALPGFDVVVLLQPTSPLRTTADIDGACELFAASGAPSCVSVSLAEQSPYWMYRRGGDGTLKPVLDLPAGVVRRQDLPPVYTLNGAVYVTGVAGLHATSSFVTSGTVGYVMPPERSIDIDTAADFEAFRAHVSKVANTTSEAIALHD